MVGNIWPVGRCSDSWLAQMEDPVGRGIRKVRRSKLKGSLKITQAAVFPASVLASTHPHPCWLVVCGTPSTLTFNPSQFLSVRLLWSRFQSYCPHPPPHSFYFTFSSSAPGLESNPIFLFLQELSCLSFLWKLPYLLRSFFSRKWVCKWTVFFFFF